MIGGEEAVMSGRIFKVGGATVLMAALASLSSPVESAAMSLLVPFGFAVGGKALPAGHYQISIENGVLLVRGAQDGALILTLAGPSRDEAPKLVFHKYGEHVQLREVYAGGRAGRLVPESSLERELKERARSANLQLERIEVPAL
jgi:hypothetical protein